MTHRQTIVSLIAIHGTPILLLIACYMLCLHASAIPAYPWPFVVTQPDGTTLTIRLEGDEHGFMAYTGDGYPIVQNMATGCYEYAAMTSQGLTCSGIAATDDGHRTPQEEAYIEQMDISAMQQLQQGARRISRQSQRILINDFPRMGTQRSLVILVQFSDMMFTSVDDPYEYYYNMLNQEGFTHVNGANGSASDFYHVCSHGQFDPKFDVIGPVTLPNPASYYGTDSRTMLDSLAYQMVLDACALADAEVDFSQYDLNDDGVVDNIYFFYAGFGQADSGQGQTIWPHAGKLNEDWHQPMPMHDGVYINRYAASNEIRYGTGPNFKPVGIGTFVHEFAHVLGLADHYDTAYNGSFHPNTWDTMAAASYNDNQNTPPAFSAYERAELGWLGYTEIAPATAGLLTLHELQADNHAFRLMVPETDDHEYYVLENRQKVGWDRSLPGHGMLVWHIDEDEQLWMTNKINIDPAHQHIDIVEADRQPTTTSYQGDPFPGTGHVTTFDFYDWAQENLFSFDYVEETGDSVSFLLARTDFLPQRPQLSVGDLMGKSMTVSWTAVPQARSYELTIEQLAADGQVVGMVNGYDHVVMDHADTLTVTGLTPLTTYRVTLQSQIGSYKSEASSIEVSTTSIQFAETAPVATAATGVTATGFTAHWQPLDRAQTYLVNVYRNDYSDVVTEGYGFDQKADGIPECWQTSTTQYNQTMYGQAKPSLQLNKQDDHITISYPGSRVVSISFWQRSQLSSNVLHIEARDSDDADWTDLQAVDMSTTGEVVTIDVDSVAQVRIRFERKGSYALLDDIEVSYTTLNQLPVEGFTSLDAGEHHQLAIEGLPQAGNYVYRVQGVKDGEFSLLSNAVPVTLSTGAPGDVNGDSEVNIADVNAVIDIILGGSGAATAADVNGDGEINIADVNAIIDIILQGK